MTETNPTELAANDAENYPETLRITVGSVDSMVDTAVARLGDDGPAEAAVRTFDSVAEIRALLTDRRIELMRSIMTTPPDSITGLANQVNRNYADVHADVEVLADHDIVYFETDGRAKRPVIPYERVQIDIEVVGDTGNERATAS